MFNRRVAPHETSKAGASFGHPLTQWIGWTGLREMLRQIIYFMGNLGHFDGFR